MPRTYTEEEIRDLVRLAFEETGEGDNGEWCCCGSWLPGSNKEEQRRVEHEEHMEQHYEDTMRVFDEMHPDLT